MKRRDDLPQPLNAQERLLYAIAVRVDILIEQVNSVVEHIAKQDNVATTNHKTIESTSVEKTVAKPVQKVEVKAEVEAKPAPKRAPRKVAKKEE